MADRLSTQLLYFILGLAAVGVNVYAVIASKGPALFALSIALMNGCIIRLWIGRQRKPRNGRGNVRPMVRKPRRGFFRSKVARYVAERGAR